MKALYLTGSIIFTVTILILAFGNIGAQFSNMTFFFYSVNSSPTIIIMGIAVIGIITGMLYHAFISKVLDSTPDDEESDFE
jgi:uncharacterized integral membrane protein